MPQIETHRAVISNGNVLIISNTCPDSRVCYTTSNGSITEICEHYESHITNKMTKIRDWCSYGTLR